MRIAIVADIHGNVAALEALLADLRIHGTWDAVINLGDCVSGPLWPAETCAVLMQHAWPTVRGNHDRAVGCDDPATMGASDHYAWSHLSPGKRRWLGDLPATLSIADGILACHGRPDSDSRYLLDDIAGGRLVASSAPRVEARLDAVTAALRLVLCGHSHQPRACTLSSGCLVINPGSVGCPAYDDTSGTPHCSEAGTPHARYATATLSDGGATSFELRAVAYDHMAASRRAAANGRPDWAVALATGRMPA